MTKLRFLGVDVTQMFRSHKTHSFCQKPAEDRQIFVLMKPMLNSLDHTGLCWRAHHAAFLKKWTIRGRPWTPSFRREINTAWIVPKSFQLVLDSRGRSWIFEKRTVEGRGGEKRGWLRNAWQRGNFLQRWEETLFSYEVAFCRPEELIIVILIEKWFWFEFRSWFASVCVWGKRVIY